MSCDQCINSSGWIFWTFTVGFGVLLLPEAHFIIGFWSRMFCIIISTYFERSWKIRIYQKIGLYSCLTCLRLYNSIIYEYYNLYNNTFANSAVCWTSDFCFWIRTVWFKSGAPFFIFAYSSNINKTVDDINWQRDFLDCDFHNRYWTIYICFYKNRLPIFMHPFFLPRVCSIPPIQYSNHNSPLFLRFLFCSGGGRWLLCRSTSPYMVHVGCALHICCGRYGVSLCRSTSDCMSHSSCGVQICWRMCGLM